METVAKAGIVVTELSKSYVGKDSETDHGVVFENLNLTVKSGEICTIFGPNGSGKTTLLNMLAGVADADRGTISIDGMPPRPGLAAYVFQNFKDSLFPWRTVEGNLLFPLECQIVDGKERRDRLKEFVKEFGFSLPLQSKVYELSIGQQQMVTLARALITRPRLLLMDEPFSALDLRIRHSMQSELLAYQKKHGATILFVSHEIDEAIFLGQRLFLFPPRPVKTIREISIDLVFPRSREVFYTKDFFRIRSDVLRFFEDDASLAK